MSVPVWIRAGLALTLGISCHASALAETVATLTMKMGAATVIQGASRFTAVEGMRLSAEDIIETADNTQLIRLELDNQTVLDLGPRARLALQPKWPGTSISGGYLLQGWAKATPAPNTGAGTPNAAMLMTPQLEVQAASAEVVAFSHDNMTELFSPAGQARLLHRGKQNQKMPLDKGHYLQVKASGTLPAAVRPEPAFIQAVPRPFMDTLPRRIEKFSGKKVTLAAPSTPNYADLQPWLEAEPKLRARWPTRWQALLQDPTFKSAVLKQLPRHPEWTSLVSPAPASPRATSNPTYTQP